MQQLQKPGTPATSRPTKASGLRPCWSTRLLALLAALLAAVAVTPGTSQGAVPPGGGALNPPVPGAMQRWSAAHMAKATDRPASVEAAVEIARRFNLIVVANGEFDAYETEMHAANPLLKTLVYLNGTYGGTSATAWPDSWYARDIYGNKITSKLFNNYLMDVSNPLWADNRAKVCSNLLASTHVDGCYADMMGVSSLNPNYCTGRAVNPATGKVWTQAAYIAATNAIAERIRAVNNVPLAGNGLGNGTRFYSGAQSSKDILKSLDAGHSEIWLRDGRTPITGWPDEPTWKKNVDMLVDAASIGGSILAQTKVWITATPEQIDAWHRYALASFLLGNDGKSWFTFSDARTLAAATIDHPWDRVDVGVPTGPYERVDGVYQRSFTNGFAAVNPTTAPATVTLPPGVYTNLNGEIVTSETLPPHGGDVFTLVPPPVTPERNGSL